MPIADNRETQIFTTPAVTDHAAECFSQHTRSVTVGQVCRTAVTTVEHVIDFSIFHLEVLPLGPRSPKGEMTYYPPRSTILQKFSPIAQTVYEICVTKVFFHFLAPGGLTPDLKFTKRGNDLADAELYHPAKFHRSTPTHARDIPYKKSCGHTHTHTNKQTVTDISTACLSACVDNNYKNVKITTATVEYHLVLTRL